MHDTPYRQAVKDSQPSQKTPLFSREPVACPTATIPAEAVRVRGSRKHTSPQPKVLTYTLDITYSPLRNHHFMGSYGKTSSSWLTEGVG